MSPAPKCKLCGSELRGYKHPEQTIHHAEIGDLKGWCPIHYWQEITPQEQQTLVEDARKKMTES